MKLSSSLLALLLTPVAFAAAPKTPSVAEMEGLDLGLGQAGATAEACYFAYCWTHYVTGAQVRLLAPEGPAAPGKQGDLVAVYVVDGKLRAHSARFGTVELPGLGTEDLAKEENLRTVYRAQAAKAELRADKAAPDSDAQARLYGAKTLMHHGFADENFPVTVSQLDGQRRLPNGESEKTRIECLVLDFGGRHYLYQKGGSNTHVLDIPQNGVTHQPGACVPRNDVIEALLLVADYRRQHPEERAVLLLPQQQNRLLGTFAGAAFTEKGKVYFYNLFSGVFPAEGHRPEDLGKPETLADELMEKLRRMFLNAIHRQTGQTGPISLDASSLYDKLPPPLPERLPGDNEELQLRRLRDRLQVAGIPVEKGATNGLLKINFDGYELRYQLGQGTHLRVKAANADIAAIPESGTRSTDDSPANQAKASASLDKPATAEAADKLPPSHLPATGKGKPRGASLYEPSKADIERLEKQSAEGVVAASKELAEYLLAGKYVPKDVDRAIQLLKSAAATGDADAALSIAMQLGDHPRSDEDRSTAFTYYMQAAKAGYRVAQYNVGAMLASGRGVAFDRIEGLAWMILANKHGMRGEGEAQLRRDLAGHPERIQQAETRALELQGECASNPDEDKAPLRPPGTGTTTNRPLPSIP